MDSPLLAVRNLTTRFPTRRATATAVDDVGFDVAAGETLAIVGESGSGKSVTALSLLRLIERSGGHIHSGEAWFEGQDLLRASEAAMRQVRGNRIAMVFQEPMTCLNPVLTIGRQVAEPMVLHQRIGWRAAYAQARVLLEQVHMPDAQRRLAAYPHQLSGGMRQRVMIAMALACQPRLIIADEPTTALDVTVQAQILDLLKDLTRDAGIALILITHDLGVVARYADRVAVMYAGRIVESARAGVLYSRPRHPYTQGLLASIPRLGGEVNDRLTPIDGQPPDLSRLPPGCAFAPRCKRAVARCHALQPPLRAEEGGRLRACYVDD